MLPTDTVYGIGADAFDPDAVQRLLDAKMRGRDMPPPVLIAEASLLRALATEVPEPAKELIERHWPGPLTIICKRQPSLRMDLGDSEGTVALRVPDHALARDILRGTGPMAVSSANLSGRPAAVTCDEALDQLGDQVSVYLDGGPLGGERRRTFDHRRLHPPSHRSGAAARSVECRGATRELPRSGGPGRGGVRGVARLRLFDRLRA